LKQKALIEIKTAEVAFRVLAFADLHATLHCAIAPRGRAP
jgi:hypothetical protein